MFNLIYSALYNTINIITVKNLSLLALYLYEWHSRLAYVKSRDSFVVEYELQMTPWSHIWMNDKDKMMITSI